MPFDSLDMPPPRIIQQLVAHCEDKGINLIIATDANAHHTVWGSSNTNRRGESLLEFIAATNLIVCNRGNSPTFSNVIRQEVLDLTLCSMNIQDRIHGWRVLDEHMFSDHHPITFCYEFEPNSEPEGYKNIRKTHWGFFNSELQNQILHFVDHENLDSKVEQINIAIKIAYDRSCPVMYNKGASTKPHWWSSDLEKMKKTQQKLKKRYFNERTEEVRVKLNEAKHIYRKAMATARKEQWENFCENMEKLSIVARIQKIMKNGKMAEIGTLKKDNGEYTTNESETLEELFNKLMPPLQNGGDLGNDIDNIPNLSLTEETIDQIVNFTTVEAAIKAFDPFKSPDFDGIYPIMHCK